MIRRLVIAGAVSACTFAVTVLAFADTQTVRIYKVDGQKITWKKTKFDPDTKKATVEDKEYTSTVAKDATFEKAAGFGGGKKAGGKKAADPTPLEGGLTAVGEAVTKAGDKGIAASIVTTKDNGEGDVSKITTKGGFGGKKGA